MEVQFRGYSMAPRWEELVVELAVADSAPIILVKEEGSLDVNAAWKKKCVWKKNDFFKN